MKRFLITNLFILFCFETLLAQPDVYGRVDSIMRAYRSRVKTQEDCKNLCSFILSNFDADSLRFRAAVIWITENIDYDVKSSQHENYKANTVDYVLKNKKAMCGGYAALLKYLCEMLNIECIEISGKASLMNGSWGPHAWNMVKINGNIRLVDVTWMSGHVNEPEDEEVMKFTRRFNEVFYFTPPEKFILHHIPRQKQMQFLRIPKEEKELREKAIVTAAFLADSIQAIFPDTPLLKLKLGDTLKIRLKTNSNIYSMIAWSSKVKKAYYEGKTQISEGWIEFEYPVMVTGYYQLNIAYNTLTSQALVCYKLQVDPKNTE